MATDARGNLISPVGMPIALYHPNSYGWSPLAGVPFDRGRLDFNRSSTAMYPPMFSGIGQLLPQNLQTVKFADGSTGFLDPSDGTYYDSQGNDITGYVQNFGGATITGTATAAQIAAAEGIAPPAPSLISSIASALAPGPSPRVTVPAPAAAAATPGLSIGVSTDTLLIGGLGLIFVMMMMGGGGRRR